MLRYSGNLGGRTGADRICASEVPAACSASGGNVHAVLSVDASDTVALMPTTYGLPTAVPVRRPDGTLLASTWASMFDGLLSSVFDNMLYLTYWTGSTGSGELMSDGTAGDTQVPDNCAGWTAGGPSPSGLSSYGQTGYGFTTTGTEWLSDSTWGCQNTYRLLCACW